MAGVKVYARVRPCDDDAATGEALRCSDTSIEWAGRAYSFARVFGPSCGTEALYAAEFEALVCKAADGFDSAIFAYGQTGSGKTHTIFGDDASPGIARLAAASLFALIRRRAHCEFALKLSLLEIVDEKATDLLHGRAPVLFRSAAAAAGAEGAARPLLFHGLRERAVTSEAAVLAVLEEGLCARTTAPNYKHERSSRSHVVLRISVEAAHRLALVAEAGSADGAAPDAVPSSPARERASAAPAAPVGAEPSAAESVVTVGSFCLVDLAGSESASLNASSAAAAQGATINKSLLFLKQAVRALSAAPGGGAGGGGNAQTSLRNSLLTRLLQPALSGAATLAMICALPARVGAAGGARLSAPPDPTAAAEASAHRASAATPAGAFSAAAAALAAGAPAPALALFPSATLEARQLVDALDFAQAVAFVRQTEGSRRNVCALRGAGELARLHLLLVEMRAERDAAQAAAGGLSSLSAQLAEYAQLVADARSRTTSAESLAAAEREAAAREREAAVRTAAERQRLEADALALTAALALEEAEARRAHASLSAAQRELAAAQARAAQLGAALAGAASEKATLSGALGDVEARYAAVEAAAARTAEALGEQQAHVDATRAQLAAREAELGAHAASLAASEAALGALTDRHADLEAALGAKAAEGTALEARAASVEAALRAQGATLAEREAELRELHAASARLGAAVAAAEARAADARAGAEAAVAASVEEAELLATQLRASNQLLLLKHRLHTERAAIARASPLQSAANAARAVARMAALRRESGGGGGEGSPAGEPASESGWSEGAAAAATPRTPVGAHRRTRVSHGSPAL
jgi:centromeric protein E